MRRGEYSFDAYRVVFGDPQFQETLGDYLRKTGRVQDLAERFAARLSVADSSSVVRAARLMKAVEQVQKGKEAVDETTHRLLNLGQLAAAADVKQVSRDAGRIFKIYRFANYHETIAFVNAIAWVSHHTDHHPDLEVGYNRCRVAYSTHSVGGISLNDFICAAKIEALPRP